MNFERIAPSADLLPFIECYWQAESQDSTPRCQKIIPAGYPEIVFHYGSPYRIRQGGNWEQQGPCLLGGQIRQYFYLENMGASGVFGLKVKPTALTHLFGLSMEPLTDCVVDLTYALGQRLNGLWSEVARSKAMAERVATAEQYLKKFITFDPRRHLSDRAVTILRERDGLIPVNELSYQLSISERHLQRLFSHYVGLPPKFLARIIRFNRVFQLIQEGNPSWSDLVHASGYYDQSHFIRNFKAFAGEDPTKYAFSTPNLANFFLLKKK